MLMKHRITVQPISNTATVAGNCGGETSTTKSSHHVQQTPTLYLTATNNKKSLRMKKKINSNIFQRIFCSGTNKNDPIIVAIVVTFILTTFFVTSILTVFVTNTLKSSPTRPTRRMEITEDENDNGLSPSSSSYTSVSSLFNQFPSYMFHPQMKMKNKETDEEESKDKKDGAESLYNMLPYNSIYKIPDASDQVGDRSNRYIQLRYEFDTNILPINLTRSVHAVRQMQVQQQQHSTMMMMNVENTDHSGGGDRSSSSTNILANHRDAALQAVPVTVHHSDTIPYDIYDCPDTPPDGYPYQWNMMDVLNNWSPDNVTIPQSNTIYQGLCVFDYTYDLEKAITYREAEVPFVIVNDPEVARTVERWNHPGYMERMLGTVQHRTEYSENNHFMYYVPPRNHLRFRNKNRRMNRIESPVGWKQPTQSMRMTYTEWLRHANSSTSTSSIDTSTTRLVTPEQPHWYFRLIGCGYMGADGACDKGSSEYLFDELPFFQPKPSLYVVEPDEQKGIHCRFGMKDVIAENHFDGSRNSIVLLGGSRRYILTHPNQCNKLALYPKGHPSARHSAVDWSNPNLTEYPEFAQATANEVVLQAGQVLYLPTDWFHYIVSLELNFQCNTRSGITNHYKDDLRQCGF